MPPAADTNKLAALPSSRHSQELSCWFFTMKNRPCLVFLAWSTHLHLTHRLDGSLTQGNFVSCLTVFLHCEMRSWTQSTPNPPSTTHHLPWTVVGSWCKLWQPTSMSLLSTVHFQHFLYWAMTSLHFGAWVTLSHSSLWWRILAAEFWN